MAQAPALTTAACGNGGTPVGRSAWLPVAVGLAALYLPTLYDLFSSIWSTSEQAHGPMVLAICCWLLYRGWPAMLCPGEGEQSSAWGWPLAVLAALLYVLGRSQDILLFEVGSAIPLLCAAIVLLRGPRALHAQWFALFFMVFMVPLPSPVVDAVTMPMKIAVSYVAEHLLYAAGYPIARTGVMLQIGQYVLLVADACAGLHTLLTLEAMGLLYLNLVRHDSALRNVGLALCIVPISFTANVIRVSVLVMVTYHFGDAAGQGFLHGFAGMVLFASALLLIIAIDGVLHRVSRLRPPVRLTGAAP